MKVLTVGRTSQNDIVISDKTVSSQHLQLIIHDNSRVSIVNLSKNSITIVNGMKINGEYFLKPNDVVKIGNVIFQWKDYVSRFLSQSQDNKASQINSKLSLNNYKHPKENLYFGIMSFFAGVFWLIVLGVLGFQFFALASISPEMLGIFLLGISIFVIIVVLFYLLVEQYFQAVLFGNSIYVTDEQYPEIHNIVKSQENKLGLSPVKVFIYNGNGLVNAMAIRFLQKKYVILLADLVDLMIIDKRYDELSMIIGHELGHHYAGHTDFVKKFFLRPAKILPFIGTAYSRACELTADRVGYILTGNLKASQNALVSLASGSKLLSTKNNIDAFMKQEMLVPGFMGVVHKVFSTHPRITVRVLELQRFAKNHR